MRTGKCWLDKSDFDHFASGGGGGGSNHQETPRFRMQEKQLVSGEKYTTSRLHIFRDRLSFYGSVEHVG